MQKLWYKFVDFYDDVFGESEMYRRIRKGTWAKIRYWPEEGRAFFEPHEEWIKLKHEFEEPILDEGWEVTCTVNYSQTILQP